MLARPPICDNVLISDNKAAAVEWSDYKKDVCGRISEACPVPFRRVEPIEGWEPRVACCHKNVDQWVEMHPETTAVRGWVGYARYGKGLLDLTAHSVVRGADGVLFDITPTEDPNAYRGPFVVHHGDDQSFFEMERMKQPIQCHGNDPAPEIDLEAWRASMTMGAK